MMMVMQRIFHKMLPGIPAFALICFFAFVTPVNSQSLTDLSIDQKMGYAKSLTNAGKYSDALYVLDLLPAKDIESTFLKGFNFYMLGRIDSAISYFSKIPHDTISLVGKKAILFSNHCRILSGNGSILEVPIDTSSYHKELYRLQHLFNKLLSNDTKGFWTLFEEKKCHYTDLAIIEFNLYLYYNELISMKRKSPVVAAILSTIIPGAGKLYTGKPHEALTSFMPVAFNVVQAGEGYVHKKFKSPHLYVFGSIGCVFYFSGIYGSAGSARRQNREKLQYIRSKIITELGKLPALY
jgi:hypothetical protein